MQGQTKDLGTLIAHFMADIQDWERAAKKMEQDLRRIEKSTDDATKRMNANFERVGRRMESVGKQMTKYVSLPLAGIGAAAFKMGKDFEAEMQKIVGLVGVAQDQVDDWSRDLIQMAPELGKAPRELADALFFVTSAGFRGAEALDVLEMSAKASAAGLGETKVVADLVTSAINAYGIENLDAAQATDTLVAAVREGKAEAPALAQSMGQVLPIASELGVTFDQVGAATAAMTRTGTDAATAATQLRQIMTSLLKPTNQAEEALEEMGTSSAELRDMLAGDEGLVGTLAYLREITDGNSEALAEIFPNVRALSGVLDIMGKNAEENVQIFERMRDNTGALDHAFAAATDTVEFRWNKALGAGQAALVEVGRALEVIVIPMLERGARYLQGFTEWFSNLNDGTRTLIVTFGALLAAAGPVLTMMGTFTRVILPLMTSQILAVRTAMLRLNAVMLANPYLAVAAGIGLVVAALVRAERRARAANKLIQETLDMQVTGTVDELDNVNKAIDAQAAKIERIRFVQSQSMALTEADARMRRERLKTEEQILTQLALQRSEVIRLNRIQQEGLGSQLQQLRLERDILVDKKELTEEEEKRLVVLNEQIAALEKQRDTRRNMREEEQEANETLSAQLAKHTANLEKMLDVSGGITSESWDQIILEIRKSQELERQIALRQRLAQLMASGVGEQETTPQAGAAAARDEEGQLITPPDPGMFDGFNAALERTRENAKLSFVEIGDSAGAMGRAVEDAGSAMSTGWDSFIETLKNTSLELDHTVTQAFHNILNAGDASLKELAKITANTARQIIGAEIAKGVAAAARSALTNVPFPFNIAAAATAGAAAAALFSKLIPSFHTGGEVSGTGETLAVLMGGEYVLTEKQKEALQAGKPLDQATSLTYTLGQDTLGQDKLVTDSVQTSTALSDVFRTESDTVSKYVESSETASHSDKVVALENLVQSNATSTSETIANFLDKVTSFENQIETAFVSSSNVPDFATNGIPDLNVGLPDFPAPALSVPELGAVGVSVLPSIDITSPDLLSLSVPDLSLENLDIPDLVVDVPDLGLSAPDLTSPVPTMADLEVPEADIPAMTTPGLSLPNLTVPVPVVSDVTMPDMVLPGITAQEDGTAPNVPDLTMPDVQVPMPTIPEMTEPGLAIPSLTTPMPTVPGLRMPDLTLPDLPDLPDMAFAGAFHQGGIISGTGEQLALVKGGEGVFTPQQMAAMGTGGKINVAFRIPLEMNGRTVWEANRNYELDLGID